jgi:glutathione synthase
MDPLEKLNIKLDSTLRLGFALSEKKHSCFFTTPKELSWFHQPASDRKTTMARAHPLNYQGAANKVTLGEPQLISLEDFDSVHMRKDPPFDLDYLAATWILSAASEKTRIYNDPECLRRWNEKLIITRYPQDTHPALLSADVEAILEFITGPAKGDAILKPLDLFGGRGVIRTNLNTTDEAEIRRILTQETRNGEQYRLIQPFDTSIFDGEVRVFCAGPEPVAWCLKKPTGGQFLANTRAGATLSAYQPTAAEDTMVRRVARDLGNEGIFFTGFDLIGGKISEINITSPRLLAVTDDETSLYETTAQLLVDDLARPR